MNTILSNILLFLLFIANSQLLSAQQLLLTDDRVVLENAEPAAIKVLLEPKTRAVKKAFKAYMEDEKDLEIKGYSFFSKKDILQAKGQIIPDVANRKMDLYAKIIEQDGLTEMYIFGAFGYDIYITPENYPTAYRNLRFLTHDFLNHYLSEYYQEKIETVETMIEAIKDDRENAKETLISNREEVADLREENKVLIEKIRNYEQKLEAAEAKLNSRKIEKEKVVNKTTIEH